MRENNRMSAMSVVRGMLVLCVVFVGYLLLNNAETITTPVCEMLVNLDDGILNGQSFEWVSCEN